jgi:hypothetical protein
MQEDLIYDTGIWIPGRSSGGCKMCDRQTLILLQNSKLSAFVNRPSLP